MNNGTIVCKRTLTKANEVLETISLSLFPSVHHSSVFAINKQPLTIHSLLGHLLFSHSSLAYQALALAKVVTRHLSSGQSVKAPLEPRTFTELSILHRRGESAHECQSPFTVPALRPDR